jgi:hypothetical protein
VRWFVLTRKLAAAAAAFAERLAVGADQPVTTATFSA